MTAVVAKAIGVPARRLRGSAEWRFLAVVLQTAPAQAVSWWVFVLARGLLPAAFTLSVGLLVGTLQRRQPALPALLLVGVVFIAMNGLAPVHEAVSGVLGRLVGYRLQDRILGAALAPAGIAHLEHPALADDVARATSFDRGVSSPPLSAAMGPIGSGFAEVIGGAVQAALLGAYAWWAPLLVGGAWLSTHFLLRDASAWRVFESKTVVTEGRHADYAYRLGIDPAPSKEIRIFGLGDWVVDRIRDRRRRVVDAILRAQRLHRGPIGVSLAVLVVANGLFFWRLAEDAIAGRVALQALVIFAQAALGASALGFAEFDWWFRGSAQPIPSLLRLGERMASIGRLAGGSRGSDGMPRQEIRFAGVHFHYPGTAEAVLRGFELTIPAGRSLAIVGANGAGKTTIAKLLCRLYDPDEGEVRVDGVDIREFDIAAWRRRIAAVFQDFLRLELPLRDNVAPLGASERDLDSALDLSGARGLAAEETVLSRSYEGGTDLSGGQWQRVALARALYAVGQGAGVVLLDEPTAQLDVRAEARLFDRLLLATRGCTTILISHRFSTVRHADRICVVEAGQVVEQGSHEELMALGGRYRRMFDLQASSFLDEGESDAG